MSHPPPIVGYTTATPYASAALTFDPEVVDVIGSNAHAFLRANQPMTAMTSSIDCRPFPSLGTLFAALSSKAVTLIICAIENSEVGSFRSVYERVVAHSALIVGEFAVKTKCPSDGDDVPQTIWTRYVFISLTEHPILSGYAPRVALKASLVLGLSHQAGSIFRILSCFAMRNVNVLKFEMRSAQPYAFHQSLSPFSGPVNQLIDQSTDSPSPFLSSRPSQWSYLFYVDYALSPSEQVNTALLNSLKEFSMSLVQLGVYQQNLSAEDEEAQSRLQASALSHA